MFYLILITLVGISIAPFLLAKLDIWHAQGIWVQLMIMLCFSWSFFEKPKFISRKNIPLGLMHLWIGLFTGFICASVQVQGKYDIHHFFPYFNFLCLLILYNLITSYLTNKNIETILCWLRYVVILTLFTCVLQILGLSQFFKLLSKSQFANNIVTGFLGNGTHLSGFLASCIPLFLWKGKREDWLAIALTLIVLLFTGTMINDPSISGYIVTLCIFIYFFKSRWWLLLIPLSLVYFYLPKDFVSFSGRTTIWMEYLKFFKQMPITGWGPGTVNLIYRSTAVPEARHLHFELFQFTVELGIIGAVLIINMVKSFFEIKAQDRTELTLKAMVLGFLVSSCFNYPAHLWLPSAVAIFAYASIYRLTSVN